MASRVIVSKFGGSSCGNAEAYRRLGKYFLDEHSAGHKVVGVFSAMFAVTDRLLNSIQYARDGDKSGVKASREMIWNLHADTARQLLAQPGNAEEALDWMDGHLKNYFDETLERVMAKGRATAFDRDCVAHLGERLSIKLIDAHCRELDLPSALCESDNILVTTDESSNAEPLLTETQAKVDAYLRPLLDAGKIPMVSGYFGRNVDGKLMTLGRGGSDLTAAVMGYALDADEINLFKVEYTRTKDGWLKDWQPGWVGIVHDADPTVTIPVMSYDIAAELAHFGKKVLHPSTVYPAVRKQIPIYVKNNFDHSHAGTKIIDGSMIDLAAPVISITSMSVDAYENKYGVAINVMHPNLQERPNADVSATVDPVEALANLQFKYQEFLRDATRVQRSHLLQNHPDLFRLECLNLQGQLESICASSEEIVGQESASSTTANDASLDSKVEGTHTSANLSFVTLVGTGIAKSHTLLRKLRLRLKKHGIPNSIPRNVRKSDDHICVVVDSENCQRAVHALHLEFVGHHSTSVGVDRNRAKLSGGKFYVDLGDDFSPVYGAQGRQSDSAAF